MTKNYAFGKLANLKVVFQVVKLISFIGRLRRQAINGIHLHLIRVYLQALRTLYARCKRPHRR